MDIQRTLMHQTSDKLCIFPNEKLSNQKRKQHRSVISMEFHFQLSSALLLLVVGANDKLHSERRLQLNASHHAHYACSFLKAFSCSLIFL